MALNPTSSENQALSSPQMQEQLQQHKALVRAIARIREAVDLDQIFQTTVTEVRQLLSADRVAVFQFYPQRDWEGEFVCEDVAEGWSSAIKEKVYDHCFGEQFAIHYQQGKVQAVADIYDAGLSDCHVEILGKFQVRANLIVPLLQYGELWGLLCVHQCREPREWQETEIEFVQQIGDHLTVGIQQANHLQEVKLQAAKLTHTTQSDRVIAQIVDKIRPTLDIDIVFQIATEEIRHLLQVERVAIFRFNSDWSGDFVAESFEDGWLPLVGIQPTINDTYLQRTQGGRYAHNQSLAIDDIYQAGLTDCHIVLLEEFQAKSFLTVPIMQGDKIWGILAAYQNSAPRHWESYETELLIKIGTQIGVALRHHLLLGQAQYQAEQQKALTSIITRIRESLDLDTIFQTTVTEVRQMLKADRVAVFRFEPSKDWEGEFIYEDIADGWDSVISKKVYDHCFGTHFATDYHQGRIQAVTDIYDAGLSNCHIDVLGQFQVRANLIVPLIKNGSLWGLLCVHQCKNPRDWQQEEVDFVRQIADNLGVALQHNQLLVDAHYQTEQQKALTEIISRIKKSLDLQIIFQTTINEVRQLLNADRVVIFRFDTNTNWEGEFICEDVVYGCESAITEKVYEYCFSENDVNLYLQGSVTAISDIYQNDFQTSYIEILEKFQVRANVVAPLLKNGELWGLLCIHKCHTPRNWLASEIEFVTQIAEQLAMAIQQDLYLKQVQNQAIQLAEANEREKAMERQKLLAETIDKIRKSLDIQTIFKTTTEAVRELLEVERVAIYQFNANWSGKFVADSFKNGWQAVSSHQPNQKMMFAAVDVDDENLLPRNETFVPISQGEKLWGLLVAYQNSQPRYWKEEETNLLAQVGVQLGIAIQQAELLEKTQQQATKLEQAITELQQTQSQLIQGEKMAGLGQLVAGVAHEINNPVNFIFGNLTYVREYTENLFNIIDVYQKYCSNIPELQAEIANFELDFLVKDLPRTIDSMHMGAERIRQIVLSLRNFSRTDEAEQKPANIHEGLDSTLLILRHRLQSNRDRPEIKIIKDYKELPLVECFPAQLNQVFMNLLSNSIDALEEKFASIKQKSIDSRTTIPEIPLNIWIRTTAVEGKVTVAIADNGLGIPEEVRSRIFNPFFTTKEVGKGTGLGLSISYQIITEKHNGRIECLSKSGQGTEFSIEIPTRQ
ncbi:GAF domain-containing sensor histidine kinase [Calothrix sp. 336/3]|uniref:GAF domain-containing sensor histidine kinase n=1 Tax=Calothrix sp. 336/3 TaxID=1337936 RepID=UPI0004E39E09|nr:GAF domain-containing protein [Calothrix sp. 336/3]AKG20740.1 ATPase [Calothrix sp. 336/3]